VLSPWWSIRAMVAVRRDPVALILFGIDGTDRECHPVRIWMRTSDRRFYAG
jgi:hypothetical protein